MTDDDARADAPPISIEISVAHLPQAGMPVTFEAAEDECEALAVHLGVLAVEAMSAKLVARRWKRDGIVVEGRMRATLAQACVVTLDPVREEIDDPIDLIFVPESSKLARIQPVSDGELHLDPEGADIPETFRGERLDLGPFLVELLALALDPYPRSAGVEFEELDTDPDPEGAKISPFASLKQLKDPNRS